MIEIKDMSISIGDRYLVKNLNLVLNNNDKLAIIGEEGNGKSTLLKSILGICDYANITGFINLKGNRIGYLEQSINEKYLDYLVYDYLFKDNNDYYNKTSCFYKNLSLLGLEKDIIDKKISILSGGEKVKLGILKLLIEENDILFLDEPTNDLDIDTLEWLESFINNTSKPIIYISHDEMLLSNTANMILHLEQIKSKSDCKHTLLKTDYDSYVEVRIRKIETQTQLALSERREFKKKKDKLDKIMNKVEYRQNTISRANPFKAAALKAKMHSLKVQEKKLDSEDLTEKPDVEEAINLVFEDVEIPNNKRIIEINNYELKVDNKVLSKNINLSVYGNKHICIIGKNGIGKSTLIKVIYDNLKDRDDILVGYMPQTYEDILDNYEDVLDFVSPSKSKEDITRTRMLLGSMKFTRDEMTGKIKDLSNGTKAKLFLIKLVISKCNVLILDEPTRNLSPLSNPVIRRILNDFNGCIISISHDRKFISEVMDEVYKLDKNGLNIMM